MTIKFTYELETGERVPLFEADHDMAFKCFKSDQKRSVIGHAKHCVEANGLCRLPNVEEAYIGSGKDAYVIFTKSARRNFKHALHFIIPIASGRVRDTFEVNKEIKSQVLMLKAPLPGQTRAHRAKLNKARQEAVKNGAPVTPRGKPNKTRIERIGIAHRPRAIIKKGIVSFNKVMAVATM